MFSIDVSILETTLKIKVWIQKLREIICTEYFNLSCMSNQTHYQLHRSCACWSLLSCWVQRSPDAAQWSSCRNLVGFHLQLQREKRASWIPSHIKPGRTDDRRNQIQLNFMDGFRTRHFLVLVAFYWRVWCNCFCLFCSK